MIAYPFRYSFETSKNWKISKRNSPAKDTHHSQIRDIIIPWPVAAYLRIRTLIRRSNRFSSPWKARFEWSLRDPLNFIWRRLSLGQNNDAARISQHDISRTDYIWLQFCSKYSISEIALSFRKKWQKPSLHPRATTSVTPHHLYKIIRHMDGISRLCSRQNPAISSFSYLSAPL